jgi:guanylate kinase
MKKETSMNEGRLFVISGPSGAGKGTICRMLIAGSDISLSVSMTTRDPRPGETDKDYHFIPRGEFEKLIAAGEFLEYAEVYGNYYGTPKRNVEEKLKKGVDVILEIDSQGALQVKRCFPESILIFILPPSVAELRHRITGRGSDSKEVIELRMSKTMSEIECIREYDYCVVNDELPEAAARVKAIMTAERSKVSGDIHKLIEKYKEGF